MINIIKYIILILFIGCTNSSKIKNKFIDKEEYYILRGINFSEEKKFILAIEELLKANTKNEKNIITLRELGYCYAEIEELEKAKLFYKKVLIIEPKDEISLKNIAAIYYKEGNLLEAEENINRILLKSEDLFILKLKSNIYYDKKEINNAYLYLKKILQLEELFDEELYLKYIDVSKTLDKKYEIYDFLEEKYNIYKNNKTFIILYVNILENLYNDLSKGEKILKKYMAEYGYEDNILMQLSENLIKQKKYKNTYDVLKLIKFKSVRYSELKKIVEKNR
ncbi:MAG: tetratricopeptide repeat protein [Fusobacteriaceae bacterium]